MVDRRCGRGGCGRQGESGGADQARRAWPVEGDLELRPRGEIERLLKAEDGGRGLMAAARAAVGLPPGAVIAIDEVGHRADRALLIRLVGRRGRGRFGLGEVGRGVDERHLLPGLAARALHEGLDLAERPGPVPAGAELKQITVEERFEPEGGDAGHLRLGDNEDLRAMHAEGEDHSLLFLGRVIEPADTPQFDRLKGRPGYERCGHSLGPGVHLGFPGRPARLKGSFGLGHPRPDRADQLDLSGRVDRGTGLVGVVEEGEQAVILLVRERIELVGVALGALGRDPQHRLAEAVDPIEHLDHPELLRNDRPLLVEHAVAQITGGHDLVLPGIREQVAGHLLDHEAIVGEIAVECPDHPIPPHPLLARRILLVAVGVGIARQIEPVARPLLAVAVAGEEFFHRGVVAVAEIGRHVLGRRGEPDEVEPQPSAEDRRLGRGRRLEADRRKLGADEGIDRVGSRRRHLRDGRPLRAHKGPVGGVRGAGIDPPLQQRLVGISEGLLGLRRGHDCGGIGRADPVDDEALGPLPRHDRCRPGIAPGKGPVARVEAEAGLPRRAVSAMASRTVLGEDRLDLPLEVGGRFLCRERAGSEAKENQAFQSDTEAIDGH